MLNFDLTGSLDMHSEFFQKQNLAKETTSSERLGNRKKFGKKNTKSFFSAQNSLVYKKKNSRRVQIQVSLTKKKQNKFMVGDVNFHQERQQMIF